MSGSKGLADQPRHDGGHTPFNVAHTTPPADFWGWPSLESLHISLQPCALLCTIPNTFLLPLLLHRAVRRLPTATRNQQVLLRAFVEAAIPISAPEVWGSCSSGSSIARICPLLTHPFAFAVLHHDDSHASSHHTLRPFPVVFSSFFFFFFFFFLVLLLLLSFSSCFDLLVTSSTWSTLSICCQGLLVVGIVVVVVDVVDVDVNERTLFPHAFSQDSA
mmetsp:Transcript_91362/g.200163  ORF Transcript_91362/g.200163 Transcript_91362/m.200163 type:complete len:218 (+) Transcript_91362:257-910(+)